MLSPPLKQNVTVVDSEELGLLSVYWEGGTVAVLWESLEKVCIPGQHLRKPLVVDKYCGITVVSENVVTYTSVTSKEVLYNTTLNNSTKSLSLEKLQDFATLEEMVMVETLEEMEAVSFLTLEALITSVSSEKALIP